MLVVTENAGLCPKGEPNSKVFPFYYKGKIGCPSGIRPAFGCQPAFVIRLSSVKKPVFLYFPKQEKVPNAEKKIF